MMAVNCIWQNKTDASDGFLDTDAFTKGELQGRIQELSVDIPHSTRISDYCI